MGMEFVFGQLVSLLSAGEGPHPEGLYPEGVQSTVDCPSPYINCGYAGVLDACVGQRASLGMIPGRAERSRGPTEALAQLPHLVVWLCVVEVIQ